MLIVAAGDGRGAQEIEIEVGLEEVRLLVERKRVQDEPEK